MKEAKDMVFVVGLAGSPRRAGNTERLLDAFLAGAKEAGGSTEKIAISELMVASCAACAACTLDGNCIIPDEFQDVNRKLISADVISLAAPVHFAGLPAQTKALIDRGQCQWARKFVLRRPLARTASGRSHRRGVLLAAAAGLKTNFSGMRKTVRYFYNVYETAYWGELLVPGVDESGEIDGHPDVIQEAHKLGARSVTEAWDE